MFAVAAFNAAALLGAIAVGLFAGWWLISEIVGAVWLIYAVFTLSLGFARKTADRSDRT
jgi:uncharacterized membrane protein